MQNQELKKKLEQMKDLQQKVGEQDNEIKDLNEQIGRLNFEITQKQNLDEAIFYLKDELSKEKSKYTQAELQL